MEEPGNDGTAPRDHDRLLLPAEAATRLGLSQATLARWRWAGKGPEFMKIGGAVRYDPTELQFWIDAQRRRSTSDPGEVAR